MRFKMTFNNCSVWNAVNGYWEWVPSRQTSHRKCPFSTLGESGWDCVCESISRERSPCRRDDAAVAWRISLMQLRWGQVRSGQIKLRWDKWCERSFVHWPARYVTSKQMGTCLSAGISVCLGLEGAKRQDRLRHVVLVHTAWQHSS